MGLALKGEEVWWECCLRRCGSAFSALPGRSNGTLGSDLSRMLSTRHWPPWLSRGNLERTPILICSVLLQKWCKRNRSFRTSRALHSKGDFLIEDSAPILAGAKWVPVEHTDLAWRGGLFTGVQQGNQGSGKYLAGLGAVDIETRASLGIIAMDRLKEVLGRCCILRGEREADRKTSRQAASKTGGRERTRIEPLRKLTERSATDSMPRGVRKSVHRGSGQLLLFWGDFRWIPAPTAAKSGRSGRRLGEAGVGFAAGRRIPRDKNAVQADQGKNLDNPRRCVHD